jgi:hypothetical protein
MRMLEAIRVLLAELGGKGGTGDADRAIPGLRRIDQLRGFLSRGNGRQESWRGAAPQANAPTHQPVLARQPSAASVSSTVTPDVDRFSRLRSTVGVISTPKVMAKTPSVMASPFLPHSPNPSSQHAGESAPAEVDMLDVGMSHFDQDFADLELSALGEEKLGGYISPPTRSSCELNISAFSDESQNKLSAYKSSPAPSRGKSPKPVGRSEWESPGLELQVSHTSKEVVAAMDSVEAAFKRKQLRLAEGSGGLGSLLGKDVKGFRKDVAQSLLRDLAVMCGSTPLRRWLQRFCPVSAPENEKEVLVLDVEHALLLLGGLALELRVVDDSVRGDGELIELARLLRLLADGRSSVRLWDLAVLLEDAWLQKECPALLLPLSRCRHAIMHQVTLRHRLL